MIPDFNQISLEDAYSDIELTFESDKPALLKLFRDYINISYIIPESFFNHIVDITEPICEQVSSQLAYILISDTTGIEAYVKENNPKPQAFWGSVKRRR